MKTKSKICLFSIGDVNEEAGGPKTRITNIAKAIQLNDETNTIILGSKYEKLKKVLNSPKIRLLYIESNTYHFKLIDFLCLIILKYKSEKVVVYIRDIYYELAYKKLWPLKRFKNFILHKFSNLFYTVISSKMAFPTIQMGNIYFAKNRYYLNRSFFSFPPGTFIPELEFNNKPTSEVIKFLYLGSTKYQNSGFESFMKLANELHQSYEFHILTPDDISDVLISQFGGKNTENIKVLSLNHDQVLSYIHKNEITFAIHSRPRNDYDDITFPIKFMDFISCLLPVITFSHEPIVSLIGDDYPFYVQELTSNSVNECINMINIDPNLYIKTKKRFLRIRTEKLYSTQIRNLSDRVLTTE